jgi:hypothetical protein
MAREKARSSFACLVHVVMYTLPFLLLTQEPVTLAIIAGTHFAIDRWRLPKYLIWAKNLPFPGRHPFSECPSPRNHSALAFDRARDRIVLFGGHDGELVFGDTWEFDGQAWALVASVGAERRIDNGH